MKEADPIRSDRVRIESRREIRDPQPNRNRFTNSRFSRALRPGDRVYGSYVGSIYYILEQRLVDRERFSGNKGQFVSMYDHATFSGTSLTARRDSIKGLSKVEEILESIRTHVPPVYNVAVRFLGPDAQVDGQSGAVCIARKPRLGSEAYAVRIWPGISQSVIRSYEEIHECPIADRYRNILQHMNGASLFEIHLVGLPPLMAKRPPQIDRTTAWPMDIRGQQRNFRFHHHADPADFCIGYGPYSEDEHVAYVLWPNGGIEALRRGGEQIARWKDLNECLSEELARAEALYPKYEDAMERISRVPSTWSSRLRRLIGMG